MEVERNRSQIQPNWLLILLLFSFMRGNNTKKLDIQEMTLDDIDKKTRLLNRVKGYMEPEEQQILNSAETILQIVKNFKVLSDPPRIQDAEVKYSSLSFEDKRRNLLMDIGEFLEDEKKVIIHQAVDFDIKMRNLDSKISDISRLSQNGLSISNIHEYIETFEPFLSAEVRKKAMDIKKLVSIVNVIDNLRGKENLSEVDFSKVIQPFVPIEQRESIGNMIQLFQIMNGLQKEEEVAETSNNLENEDDLKIELV